jgi:thiol-disulfide isomerase/thioredoxin
MAKAMQLDENGDMHAALLSFRAQVKFKPSDAQHWNNLGVCLSDEESPTFNLFEAKEAFQQALEAPKSTDKTAKFAQQNLDDMGRFEPETDKGLLVLTEENFRAALQMHRRVLVNLYSPNCPFCLQLEPEYEAVAKEYTAARLAENPGLPVLAKLDAVAHKAVAEELGVGTFPSLRYFNVGTVEANVAARTRHDLWEFLQKRAVPLPRLETEGELLELVGGDGTAAAAATVCVAFLGDLDGPRMKAFAEAAAHPAFDNIKFAATDTKHAGAVGMAGVCDCFLCGSTNAATTWTEGDCEPVTAACGPDIGSNNCYTNCASKCDCGSRTCSGGGEDLVVVFRPRGTAGAPETLLGQHGPLATAAWLRRSALQSTVSCRRPCVGSMRPAGVVVVRSLSVSPCWIVVRTDHAHGSD